jgi:hypothetical protein
MMRAMRILWIVLAALAMGCGTTTAASPDAGPSLPAVGSNACDLREGCNLCNDGLWHCGTDVFPACPAEFDAGGSCQLVVDGGPTACVTCESEGGAGDEWQCTAYDAAPSWQAVPVPCQP